MVKRRFQLLKRFFIATSAQLEWERSPWICDNSGFVKSWSKCWNWHYTGKHQDEDNLGDIKDVADLKFSKYWCAEFEKLGCGREYGALNLQKDEIQNRDAPIYWKYFLKNPELFIMLFLKVMLTVQII